jgi:hypothetical protein
MSKISKLWVVTKPTLMSTLEDICFQVDLPNGLYNQFLGGLKPTDIVAFFDEYPFERCCKGHSKGSFIKSGICQTCGLPIPQQKEIAGRSQPND